MKTIKSTYLLVCFVLIICSTGAAQEKQAHNSELLRQQLRQVAMIRVEGKSSVIQDLHKRALLSSRKQLVDSLDDDLTALKAMETAVGGSDAETRKEIDAQIKKLTDERNDVSAEIEKGKTDSSASTSQPDSSLSVADSSAPIGSSVAASGPDRGDSPVTAVASSEPIGARHEAATAPAPPQNIDLKNWKLTNTYKDPPQLLMQEVEKAAAAIRQDQSSAPIDRLAGLSAVYPFMLLFTVADAVLPEGVEKTPGVANIRTIERLQYLGETARTDKQIGASARSSGSTSAIEKPGFAQLLGFAIENGAILQNTNNSTLTLSTSPYILYTMNGGGDTEENYNRAGFLNRIGISASFNMNDPTNPLASVKRGDLTEWSVKARLFGDHSTRSKKFHDFWDQKLRPFVEEKGRSLGRPADFIDNNPALLGLRNRTRTQLMAAMTELLDDPDYKKETDPNKKETMLQNVMYGFMRAEVFDQIRSNAVNVGFEQRAKINDVFVPRIAQAFANMVEAKKILREGLDELSKSPLATFAYTNHRQPTASDYSEFKFLYEQDKTVFRLLKVVGNASFSVYNKPNPLLHQTRLRDFSAALSFEGAVDSPFLKNQPDLSKITYAFTGNYERLRENEGMKGRKPDLAAFQFKVNVPIYGGFTLPFSITYASGTETTKKEHSRFNFGLNFDMDKLFALTRLVGKP